MKWLEHASVVLETYEMRFLKKISCINDVVWEYFDQIQIIVFGFFDFSGLREAFYTFCNARSSFFFGFWRLDVALLFDWSKFYQRFFFKSPEQSTQILLSLSI